MTYIIRLVIYIFCDMYVLVKINIKISTLRKMLRMTSKKDRFCLTVPVRCQLGIILQRIRFMI
jgi:hypothetical protein